MCCLLLTLLNEGGDSTSAPGAVCMGYDSPRRPYHGSLDPASMFSCFSTWNSRPLGSGKPTETTALHPPLGVGLGGQRRKTRVSPGGIDPLTFRSPSQHCLTSICQRRVAEPVGRQRRPLILKRFTEKGVSEVGAGREHSCSTPLSLLVHVAVGR